MVYNVQIYSIYFLKQKDAKAAEYIETSKCYPISPFPLTFNGVYSALFCWQVIQLIV